MSPDERPSRVLILMPIGRDGRATAEVLRRAALAATVCESLPHLLKELDQGAGAVCLVEEALTEEGYGPLKKWVVDQPPWSDLPFVMLSSRSDDASTRLWRENLTLALRNVSLLERPVQALTLISALRVALRSRARQYEVRAHIETQERAAHTLEDLVVDRTKALADANERLMRQIAEREQIEDQLRQAQKMEAMGQLTGGLAHDFNNMLAIVVAALNLLSRRIKTPDPVIAKYIDAAHEGVQRASQLTQRLLAFSRRQALAPKAVDPDKLIHGMSELLRGTLGRDVVLETATDDGDWNIFVDPGELENAILNIALNARDAMPNGGTLTITTEAAKLEDDAPYVLITIADTGSGISQDIIDKVFEPFFTTKVVGKGTGLGLSQVYGFVKQSGGHIKISSRDGGGTTIKLYLPRHTKIVATAADQPAPAHAALPTGRKELILVVDDEPAVRGLAADSLEELGYRAIEAADGNTALKLLDQHPEIDMLLTDIVMPDLNGRMLADRAKRSRPSLKVLFMTGYSRDAVVQNGVLESGVQLIGKPFTIEELSDKVRAVLGAAG